MTSNPSLTDTASLGCTSTAQLPQAVEPGNRRRAPCPTTRQRYSSGPDDARVAGNARDNGEIRS